MRSNAKKLFVRLFIYLTGCILLLIYLRMCEMGYGIPCFFYENFHIVCPSCGATRAFIAIISGEFKDAIEFNPVFTLGFYPITGILLLQDIFVAIYRVIKNQNMVSMIEFAWKSNSREEKR